MQPHVFYMKRLRNNISNCKLFRLGFIFYTWFLGSRLFFGLFFVLSQETNFLKVNFFCFFSCFRFKIESQRKLN